MFKSRFYNKIEEFENSIKKSSINSNKILEEINFYKNLPLEIADFFPKIQNYEINDLESFYFLDKIKAKTVSDTFLDNFEIVQYKKFLNLAFDFIRARPAKMENAIKSCEYLYFEKVKNRYLLFKKVGLYTKFCDNLIYNQFIQKYEDLLNRYFYLANKILIPSNYVTYQHGDFCLTNMFIENEKLKLIDPMGYNERFQGMHDPLYDLAKFSHSILGNYDRILNDDFDIILKEKDFPFSLKLNNNNYFDYYKIQFKNELIKYDFDLNQIKIREASLFLSMLPLHPESARRISAFILQAESIITELEKSY